MRNKNLTVLLTFLFGTSLVPRSNAQDTRPRIERDVVYAQINSMPLKLDLYLPQDTTGPVPVIIWFHGGAWISGSKENPRAARMTEQGYAVASVGYRLLNEALFPAQIEDCKVAVRWLRANAAKYNLDSNRIGVWGVSAGGHLAALLGTSTGVKELEGTGAHLEYSSRVQAVVDFYGPTDLAQMSESMSKRNGNLRDLLGRAAQQLRGWLTAANPVTYVSSDDPPFLILHGDRDQTVPVSQSQLLADALKQAGVEVQFKIIEGAGHSLPGPEIDSMVDEFFARHLKR